MCESEVEEAALSWLKGLGYAELDGGELLPGFRCPIADLFVNP
jgi:hypothetical protein